MNILIDTHVLIWLQEGDEKLPIEWRTMIENPENTKYISIASIWEIAIKTNIGKLEISIPLNNFVPAEIEIIPLKINHLTRYQQLPLHHKDPFDRILIAQSLEENFTIMTADERFSLYHVSLIS